MTKKILRQKYYYSGGCIRLVRRDADIIRGMMSKAFEQVADKSLLLQGLSGVSSPLAVNSLVSVRPGDEEAPQFFVVSNYILRRLSLVVDDKLLEAMRSVNTENPVWQGWVFEFQFLQTLKRNICTTLNTWNDTGAPLTISFSTNVEPYPSSKVRELTENVCYIPQKWNQGCFDAVFFHVDEDQNKCFDFLNTTLAEHHKFKCKYIAEFLAWVIGAAPPADFRFKVALYAVTTHANKTRFKLSSCQVVDFEEVRKFDASFQDTIQLLCTDCF